MQKNKTGDQIIALPFPLTTLLITSFMLFQLLTACSKTSIQPSVSKPDQLLQLVHGNPIGENSSATIGPEGGSLSSNDGNIKIEVPQGAIDGVTTFHIQEVENVLHNKAKSYRLLPEGLEFKKPVHITYYYGGIDLGGTNPDLLFLAYQDKDGRFYSANKTRGDRQKQTLKVSTTHFSDWTFYAQYDLYFPDHQLSNGLLRLTEGESAKIELKAVLNDKYDTTYAEMKLADLSASMIVRKAAWDYTPKKGTMNSTPEAASAVYHAPAKVNGMENVYLNITLNGILGLDNLGNPVQQIQIRQPIVISSEGYFTLSENGVELQASHFDGEFTQLVGSQLVAQFSNGYLLTCYTYGGSIGSFNYDEHFTPGAAVLGLVQGDKAGMGVMRAKICDKDPTPVFSPGAFKLKSVASKKGEYFEGEFSATMYGFDFCQTGRTKTLSGKFRFRKTN